MTKRKRRASGPTQSESRTRELGSPVVAARYPQELLAAIDAARADEPRQRWLVEAARQRLERDGRERAVASLVDEHLELLRAGVPSSDPRQVSVESRLSELVRSGRPVTKLSDEAGARAREWFGEAEREAVK